MHYQDIFCPFIFCPISSDKKLSDKRCLDFLIRRPHHRTLGESSNRFAHRAAIDLMHMPWLAEPGQQRDSQFATEMLAELFQTIEDGFFTERRIINW